MTAPEPRAIEWASSEVEDATLTVELTGSSSKAWKSRFEGVLAMLDSPHSRWGAVRITKKGIEVTGLQQGSESELRHFLESIVLQVNTDTEPDVPREDEQLEEDHEPDPDERMTETFRGFAPEHQ